MKNAESVANYVVAYGMKIGRPITNLQLQKILYYIQVQFLKETEKPFFRDSIEAWQVGPVVPGVYFKYASFGTAPITVFKALEKDWSTEEEERLNQLISEKAVLSLANMVEDVCQKGKAWDMYYKPGARTVIPKKAMKLYG